MAEKSEIAIRFIQNYDPSAEPLFTDVDMALYLAATVEGVDARPFNERVADAVEFMRQRRSVSRPL